MALPGMTLVTLGISETSRPVLTVRSRPQLPILRYRNYPGFACDGREEVQSSGVRDSQMEAVEHCLRVDPSSVSSEEVRV